MVYSKYDPASQDLWEDPKSLGRSAACLFCFFGFWAPVVTMKSKSTYFSQRSLNSLEVEPLILDSDTPMVWILEPEGGSTFWICPGVCLGLGDSNLVIAQDISRYSVGVSRVANVLVPSS